MKRPAKTQTFFDHLEELRGRVLQFLGVYIVCCFFAYNLTGNILPYIIKPVRMVVFSAPGEAFSAYMIMTLFGGFILALPVFLYHAWAFAWQALTPQERKYVLLFGPLSFIFFVAGILFAYYAVVPLALQFLLSFSSEFVVPMIGIKNYISFVGNFVLAFGIVFELPLVLVFLVKIGIATPAFLSQYRRHAIMVILIVSAILTPPDVVSQLFMAVPLIVLYELGVLFSMMAYRGKV